MSTFLNGDNARIAYRENGVNNFFLNFLTFYKVFFNSTNTMPRVSHFFVTLLRKNQSLDAKIHSAKKLNFRRKRSLTRLAREECPA